MKDTNTEKNNRKQTAGAEPRKKAAAAEPDRQSPVLTRLYGPNDGTPDSPFYNFVFLAGGLLRGGSPRVTVKDELLKEASVPYIMLVNHASFFDFLYVNKLHHPRRPSYLINEYHSTRPVLRFFKKRIGMISKKQFYSDLAAPMGIFRTLKKGYPVVIFPEGRTCTDGRSYPIVEEGAAFYKKLDVDLVIARVRGAYFAAPKWRGRRYHRGAAVTVEVMKVLKKDAMKAMSDDELNAEIEKNLRENASLDIQCRYRQHGKARGLENVLYRCPECGSVYTIKSRGNSLYCTSCGFTRTLNEDYHFTEEPYMISDWYDRIVEMERKELPGLHETIDVKAVIHGAKGGPTRKEMGVCTLTEEALSYHSDSIDFSVSMDNIPCFAYSAGTEIDFYYKNELYYFYPVEHPQDPARWALFADLLYEKRKNEEQPHIAP